MRTHNALTQGRLFFLTEAQWLFATGAGLTVAGVLWSSYANISIWIGVAIFIMSLVIAHMILSARYILPIPHLAILFAGLGYVIAPWLSIYFPSGDPEYSVLDVEVYFHYSGPLFLAITVGWALPFLPLGGQITKINWNMNPVPGLLPFFDLLIIGGSLLELLVIFSPVEIPIAVRFVVHLLSKLRYVGLFGWMISRKSGWRMRMWLIWSLELFLAVWFALFLELALWTLCIVSFYAHLWTMKTHLFAGLVVTGAITLIGVQVAKTELRNVGWYGEEASIEVFGHEFVPSLSNKPFVWLGKVLQITVQLVTGQLDSQLLGESLVRYNQGWIISRIMSYVPINEPYARGSTLVTAIKGAVLPRFVDVQKHRAGGAEYFDRFVGRPLVGNTSMNLGYAGEMYANFGARGGIFGCGLYALFFSAGYVMMVKSAKKRPLVLAFIPYVFLWVALMEVGISEVLNFTFKAWVLSLCFLWLAAALSAPTERKALIRPAT